MSILITDKNGIEWDCYLSRDGGFANFLYRIASPASWEQWALQHGHMMEVTDDEGNTSTVPTPGTTITELGKVMLTPGTYDQDGNELTAPTFDTKNHVNLRLSGPRLTERPDGAIDGLFTWEIDAIDFAQNGQSGAPNKAERSHRLQSVEALDPVSVASPARIWLT